MNLSRRGLFKMTFGAMVAPFAAKAVPVAKPPVVTEPPQLFRVYWSVFVDGEWVDQGFTEFDPGIPEWFPETTT